MKDKIKDCISYVIREYINDREMRAWFEGNMLYYKNRLNNEGTHKQAFDFVIQSPLSIFHLTREEEQQVADELWAMLERKNHSLTRIW